MTPGARTVVGLAVLCSLTGCAAVTGRSCSDVGAVNGVGVDLAPFLRTHRGSWVARVCADDDCGSEQVSRRRRTETLAGTRTVEGDRPVRVTVQVTSAGGAVVGASATVIPGRNQPNGPGCPPTAWSARVRLNAAGHLVIVDLPGE